MTQTLWDFAVSTYRRAGVAECCLRLQDRAGADVNMLLTAAWLAGQGKCWPHNQVRQLIARCKEWRERCVLPLRDVRRYLTAHPLYEKAKALELDAEIHQLHVLQETLQSMHLENQDKPLADALSVNLHIYFECLAQDRAAIANDDLRALIAELSR